METEKNCFELIVLVPHRDARLPLTAWSASLFAAGLAGAYSFPWVAPLAQVSCPLSGEELKTLAADVRSFLNSGCGAGAGDKLTAGDPASAALPDCSGCKVWGPGLNAELPDDFFDAASDAVVRRISPLVLGCALINGSVPADLPPPPDVSFRAAALANMTCRLSPFDNGSYAFEWKIGKLCWLPKK